MKWRKQIHNLWKTLVWEMVDQVLIVEVWPLRRSEPDRLFGDQIIGEQHCPCHLDDLLMMEKRVENRNSVEYLWIRILVLVWLSVS